MELTGEVKHRRQESVVEAKVVGALPITSVKKERAIGLTS